MKKFAAVLLAVCLALQTCAGLAVPVYGAAEPQRAQQEAESVLKIEVASSQLFPYEGVVRVEVRSGSGAVYKRELSFAQEGRAEAAEAGFEVPAGDYTVSIRAKKFADYVQAVNLKEGWTHRIYVNPVQAEEGSQSQMGWLRAGDIDGDGDIDEADSKALLAAVRAGQADTVYDLNGDGRVDLADLAILVQSINEKQEAAVESLCVPLGIQAPDSTRVEGNQSDFLEGKDTITLKPVSGGIISQSNPLEFTIKMPGGASGAMLGGIELHTPLVTNDDGSTAGQIASGSITVVSVNENGSEHTREYPLEIKQQGRLLAAAEASVKASAIIGADGSISLDFGGQIAVKQITIRITGTTKNQPLVEIAQVKFLNGMGDRIPEPELSIPSIISVEERNMSLFVSWTAQNNVTGYELSVSGPAAGGRTETQVIRTAGTSCLISSINNAKLLNYSTYTIMVRSINGEWNSPWSASVTGRPRALNKPQPPDNVKAAGGYRSISVSWKAMDDAAGYMVYYKESTDASFQPVVSGFRQLESGEGKLTANRYSIAGLKEHTEYQVYVVSWNDAGWGSASLTAQAETRSEALPKLPKYQLLNTSNGTGKLTNHIVNATIGGSGGAAMYGSTLDTEKNSALGLVDDDYASYWSKYDWDDGPAYPASSKGMEITLDGDYKMNYITFATADQKGSLNTVRVQYWNSTGSAAAVVGARLLEKRDSNDNPYYIVKFDETVTADRIHLCLGREYGRIEMKVGEIHFHKYDPLEDEVMGLYIDEMHTTLREDVTEEMIRALEARLDTIDPASGEKHPLRSEIAVELQTAREILANDLAPSYKVHSQITAAKDGHLKFNGLNAWQPLGRTADAGDTLLVYVGHNTKRTGDKADLQLVFTQYNAEYTNVSASKSLRVGRNEITVPRIGSTVQEHGGQLYVSYTGNRDSDQYAVRIGGGTSIPVLDVYRKTGADRTQAIRTYIKSLETYAAAIQEGHAKEHAGSANEKFDYSAAGCILNATDIMMEQMMYSLPATQILAGLSSVQGLDAKAAQLDNALKAMEQTMELFYQHKGLSSEAGNVRGNNALPSQHLNIRYMRMFAGAFMYAAGNHIGIQWGSARLSALKDWNSLGWGIAHEIGHNINQGAYEAAEITNNYYAKLLTGSKRYTDQAVYQKVTSGAVGRSSNIATQLAMYWQLHQAFDDKKDDRHIYSSYEEQFNGLFFARVDTYARNPEKAPQPGLKVDGGADQNLMRLACAAADKNILPFFERWGMAPDAATMKYAEKYGEPDKKAVYYVNETARDYRVEHKASGEAGTILGRDVITAKASDDSSQVTVDIKLNDGADADVILGYEVIRSMVRNGKAEKQVAGFQPFASAASTKFVDTVTTVNNRVLHYEVKAVDKFLNYSQAADAGDCKIQTDGVLDKSGWTVETDMVSEDDLYVEKGEDDPDSGYQIDGSGNITQTEQEKVNSIDRVIDNRREGTGVYHESETNPPAEASITIDMHRTEAVTALKYDGEAFTSVTAEVSEDGQKWTTVKKDYEGTFADGKGTIWFDAVKEEERTNWIGTYDARYVKLTIKKAGTLSIKEIDICGPSGDNLEFLDTGSVGILKNDLHYDNGTGGVKAGALIFTGTYKGNPAYNVVMLYDQDGNVIGSVNNQGETKSSQLIFAKVPENGSLGTTSDGKWLYYIEAGSWKPEDFKGRKIRAELYRVDDAQTLEGERIVSDTKLIDMPDTLQHIDISGIEIVSE